MSAVLVKAERAEDKRRQRQEATIKRQTQKYTGKTHKAHEMVCKG